MEPKTLIVGLIEVNSVIVFWSGLILSFLSGRWMLAGVTSAPVGAFISLTPIDF